MHINPQYQEDFAAAVNFIAESVEPLSRQNTRNVATTNTTNQNQNPQIQGQGRGRGRQNYQGRGQNYRGGYQGRHHRTPYDHQRGRYGSYRGGGRNNFQGRGGRGGRYNQRNQMNDGTYFSRSEWDALSNQERQDAIQARSQRRLESLHNNDNASVISQITTQTNAQAQAETNVQGGSIAQVSTNNSHTASAFGGRAGYRGG